MPHVDNGVGWKRGDTSRSAAVSTALHAGVVRAQVLACLKASDHPMTADAITDAIGLDAFTVRPRISELRNDGRIVDSGERHPGNRGRNQTAWMLAPQKKET